MERARVSFGVRLTSEKRRGGKTKSKREKGKFIVNLLSGERALWREEKRERERERQKRKSGSDVQKARVLFTLTWGGPEERNRERKRESRRIRPRDEGMTRMLLGSIATDWLPPILSFRSANEKRVNEWKWEEKPAENRLRHSVFSRSLSPPRATRAEGSPISNERSIARSEYPFSLPYGSRTYFWRSVTHVSCLVRLRLTNSTLNTL